MVKLSPFSQVCWGRKRGWEPLFLKSHVQTFQDLQIRAKTISTVLVPFSNDTWQSAQSLDTEGSKHNKRCFPHLKKEGLNVWLREQLWKHIAKDKGNPFFYALSVLVVDINV